MKVFVLLALAAAEEPSTCATSSKDCAAKIENDVHSLIQARLQIGADNLTASSLQTSSASKPARDRDLRSKNVWQCWDRTEFWHWDQIDDSGQKSKIPHYHCSNYGFPSMQACQDRCTKVNQCQWAMYHRHESRCGKQGYCVMRDGSKGHLRWWSGQSCRKPLTKACGEGDVMAANIAGEQTMPRSGQEFVPWVWHSGEWYPICGHYFWDNNYGATIVCQALGFKWGTSRVVRDKYSKQAMGVGRCTCSKHFQRGACAGKTLTTCAGDWGNFCWGGCNKCSPGAAVGIRVQCTSGVGHPASCHAADIVDTCKPKSTSNQDQGYNDPFRGWYDVQGCGKCYDYCRWVGNSGSGGDPSKKVTHGSSWWSCSLAGGSVAFTPRNHFTPWQFANMFSKCAGEGAAAPRR